MSANSDFWKNLMSKMDVREESNQFGNTVYYAFDPVSDAFTFHNGACNSEEKWNVLETHQDAPYFGVWYNFQQLRIVTFCEGDLTVEDAKDDEGFKAALAHARAFYKKLEG